MAEIITLDLELIDRVGGPAKRAADALRRIEMQQQKAQQQVNRAAEAQAKALEKFKDKEAAAMRRLGVQQSQAARMNEQMSAQARRLVERQAQAVERAKAREQAAIRKTALLQVQARKEDEHREKQRKATGFFGSFGKALPFRSIGDYTKGAFFGGLAANAVTGIVGGFVSGAQKAVGIVGTGIEKAFEFGAKSEQQRLGYKLTLGAKGGAAFEAETRRMGKGGAFNELAIGNIMTMLNQAGLKGQAGRTAFATAGDIAAAQGRGTDEHAVEEIATQLANVKLGGSIDKQHLRSLGLDFHEFYESLGKKLGMNADAVQKRASEGKVDPQHLLNEITERVNARQGGMAGTGMRQSGNTMQAQLQRLGSMPELYLSRMSQSPAWAKLTQRMASTLEGLDPDGPRGQKIMGALFNTFDRLAGFIERTLTPKNIDRFADGVSKVVDTFAKLPEILNTTLKITEAFAAIWVGKKLVDSIAVIAEMLAKLSKFTLPPVANPVPAAAGGAAGRGLAALGAGAIPALALGAVAVHDSLIDSMGDGMNRASKGLQGDLAAGRKIAKPGMFGFTSYEDVTDPEAQKRAATDYAASVRKAGGTITVNQPGIVINVNAPDGANAGDVANQVGAAVGKHTASALERAALERGGG